MDIPDDVKQQAMDAVSHKETTDQIRAYQGSGVDVSPADTFTNAQQPQPEITPIPDEVKQQAMDAVSHAETRAQIQLVVDNGAVTAPITPGRDTEQIAEKVARLHEAGQDMDTTHKQMTQDGFGREYG